MAKMKKLFIAAMVIGLTFMAVTAFAQPAKEALLGLKKLEARCQIGISYHDYSSAVADAKFPVNVFMESAEAEKFPDLKAAINKAMGHYETANIFWNRRMNPRQGEIELQSGLIWTKSPMGQYISNAYPQAVAIAPTTGINWLLGNPKYYPLDSVLPIIWGEASKELANATALYSTIEEETVSDGRVDLKKQSKVEAKSSDSSAYAQKLRELKKLKDEGLLTDKEYEQKRKAIVDGM